MEELIIDYQTPQKERAKNIVICIPLLVLGLYESVREGLANNFNIIFYLGLFCFLLGVIVILLNIVRKSVPILSIDSKQIVAKFSAKNKFTIDWADVSRINIGPGYITFLLNGGQKQQKLELGALMYKDVLTVKSKVMELCEFKNIPYHND